MHRHANQPAYHDQFVPVPGGEIFTRLWPWPHDGPSRDLSPRESPRPPMVLLHDSLGSVELWRDFPAALAGALGCPVLAYDRLGFGQSTARATRPSPAFIHEEATVYFPALRRALALERYQLFGHSVGGAMAIAIAAHDIQGAQVLVTESAQAFVESRTIAGIQSAKTAFAAPGQLDKLRKWHGDKAPWVLDAWTEVWMDPAFANWSLDAYLPGVQCPVLAIHGDLDEYGSIAFPERIVNGVAGTSELAVMEGVGHVPHREQLRHVLQIVKDFVERQRSLRE